MDKFLKVYTGYRFNDLGAVCSNDFKVFSVNFKGYLKRCLPDCCKIISHSCGHYDLSGFVERNGRYAYYRWSWDRFSPVDIHEGNNSMRAVLYRTATNEKDFRGGHNQFCSLEQLPKKILEML